MDLFGDDIIQEFSGEYRWLSNFWPAPVVLEGVTYPSVEHAYQAAKTTQDQRKAFLRGTAGDAKRLGREVTIREGWDDVKVEVMRSFIAQKFAADTQLGEKLAQTGSCLIVEGNWWGDTFWGVCHGKGENLLGKLLMEQRSTLVDELKHEVRQSSVSVSHEYGK